MKIRPSVRVLGLATLSAMLLVACGDSTGVSGPQNVSLHFQVGSGAPLASSQPVAAPGGPSLVAGPPMAITGSNGTLTIEEIRLIIAEVELKPADGSCDAIESSGDDCPEFEAPPRFLDLPLDGEPIEAVTALIDPGTYKELDFEIEDLEDDEDDPGEAAAIAAVRSQILSEFPDWPDKASIRVAGTFEPAGGGAASEFEVYLEAEIEIEMELVPNLVVAEDGATSRVLTVDVRPDIWFGRPDGTVLELDLWHYPSTGTLLELEVEIEDGFTEIEIDLDG